MTEPAPSGLIADRFELHERRGGGGMGDVWRATDRLIGNPVAIKLLRVRERADRELALRRFAREARALAAIEHDGVVRYVDHGLDDAGRPYLAMQWLDGLDLRERLRHGPLSVAATLALGRRLCAALTAVHALGVVHRDLKPANVFLVDGDVERAVMLDFGVARLASATHALTNTGAVLGTPQFLAPEQAVGRAADVDARADLYSLGALLFAAITGEPPFPGDNPVAVLAKVAVSPPPIASERRTEVPAAIDDLLAWAMAKDPAQRPHDAHAFADALARATHHAGGVERPAILRASPGAVSRAELRMLCVLLASHGAALAETLTLDGARRTPDLHEIATRFGTTLRELAHGAQVAVFEGRGEIPTEVAARCARCALSLRASAPEVPIALAMGRALVDRRLPVGEVIDRGAAMLATEEAAGSRILVDDTLASLLEQRFELVRCGEQRALVRERAEPLRARALLGVATPCVGRDRELASLEALFDECVADEQARAAIVEAPAGGGKSRLAGELVDRLRARADAPAVVAVACDPGHARSPFSTLGELVRRRLALGRGDARAGFDAVAPRLGERAEFLAELVRLPLEAPPSDVLAAARAQPQVMHDQLRRAFLAWLEVATRDAPTALVVDAAHAADRPSMAFLDGALGYLRDRGWLLIALGRPELGDAFPSLWAEHEPERVQLRRLSARACRQLAHAVLGDASDARIAAIVDAAEGNPFVLEELIRAAAAGDTAVPASVVALADARFSALDEDARLLLRAGSVFGEVFWRDGCRALLGDDGLVDSVDRRLDELVARELLGLRDSSRFDGDAELRFRHTMLRDAAYETLTDDDRPRAHAAAAAWLESRGERDAARLAAHWDAAGDAARAVPWYEHAASDAMRADDPESAARLAERAVELGAAGEQRGRLRALQAEALNWLSAPTAGADAAREAIGLLPAGSPMWSHALHQLSWGYAYLGPEHDMRPIADALLAVDTDASNTLHLCALCHCATHATDRDPELAERLLRRADELLAGPHPASAMALSAHTHAWAFYWFAVGALDRALAAHRDAQDASRRAGNERLRLLDASNAGHLLVVLGDYDGAIAALEEPLGSAEALGLAKLVDTLSANLGVALLLRGDAAAAVRALDRGHRAADGKPELHDTHLYRARAHLATGDLDRALADAELAASAVLFRRSALSITRAACADVRLARGELDLAAELAREAAAAILEETPTEETATYACTAMARALLAVGADAEARAVVECGVAALQRTAARIHDPALREQYWFRGASCPELHALAERLGVPAELPR